MKSKKFTEKRVNLFCDFIREGGLEYLSGNDEVEVLEWVAEGLHKIDEGKYFRVVLTAQDAVEAFDERAELGDLFGQTAQRISRNGEDLYEYLMSAAKQMNVTIVAPLDNGNVGNRRRITAFLGIKWYSTDAQITDELKRWL